MLDWRSAAGRRRNDQRVQGRSAKKKSGLTPQKESHKLALHGVRHRLQAIVRVQFLVDMVQMVPQGLRRNSQLASNFC